MTSAVKVEGERLYKKAHRGESIETPTRTVTIHRAELLEHEGDERHASRSSARRAPTSAP